MYISMVELLVLHLKSDYLLLDKNANHNKVSGKKAFITSVNIKEPYIMCKALSYMYYLF